MRPKISIGSMPVWPTDWALMMAVTNEKATMRTAGTGPRPSTKQITSAAAATRRARKPASVRLVRSVNLSPFFALPRSIAPMWGRTSLTTTATPAPIMRPMPRLLTMPCAAVTSSVPRAGRTAAMSA